MQETDNEEEEEEGETSYLSSQKKKRLQQQARLNLIVNSDSSESEDADKYRMIIDTSKSHIDSSDTSHCSEHDDKNERLKNDEKSRASEESGTNTLHSKHICKDICIRGDEGLNNDETICISEKRDNGLSLDKENVYELETRNIHLDASCHYRPCNVSDIR